MSPSVGSLRTSSSVCSRLLQLSLPQRRAFPKVRGIRRQTIEKGVVSPRLTVPSGILLPPYATKPDAPVEFEETFYINRPDEIDGIRRACRLAKEVLRAAGALVKPGVTTDDIDRFVHQATIDAGAYPSPLGYQGFPKSVCTSVNCVVAHGIPDSRPLREGDIINIDVTCYLETKGLGGFHGDTSATFAVGHIDPAAERLLSVSERALYKGIESVKPGQPINAVGTAISAFVKAHGMRVFGQFQGHGVGRDFHRAPWICHAVNDYPGTFQPGMVFTVEPCVTTGSLQHFMWEDNWTIETLSGANSAQFEHTVLVTDDGVELLTA
eukprot:TRINITY_DN10591_c0_g1_i1.p1 TRINITY_DN10591_c0_g1~~TRINITY_DN10591_c0_g1_i1.p1  ORF type:complete len:324 (-),score=65.61 TRINITY_DN10591_c0_g1_i1:1010-1981(-)